MAKSSELVTALRLAPRIYLSLPWVVKLSRADGSIIYMPRCMFALWMGMNVLDGWLERRAR